MSSNEKLALMALIISMLVIIGIAVCFTALFALFSFYRSRLIASGCEDDKMIGSLQTALSKENKKRRKKKLPPLTPRQYFDSDKKKSRKWQTASDLVSGIFLLFFLFVLSIGVAFRVTGNEVYIGETTYLTVMSGSMETKNADNQYLVDEDLNDQIYAYSLIGIDKVSSPDDIELYDIIAFKKDDGTVIVHRVINIGSTVVNEGSDALSVPVFLTRGDANNISASYEQQVFFDQIIGVYNGFQNFFVGTLIIYFKSEIGITALVAATFFLFLAVLALEKTTKVINGRYEYLLGFDPARFEEATIFEEAEDGGENDDAFASEEPGSNGGKEKQNREKTKVLRVKKEKNHDEQSE